MRLRRNRTALRRVGAACLLGLLLSGCSEKDLHVQNDDWADAETMLQVSVPESATRITRTVGSGGSGYSHAVEFLIPDEDWKSYVGGYYHDGLRKSKLPYSSGTTPPLCTAAFRDGAQLEAWVASDEISTPQSQEPSRRQVTVTTNCQPGLSLVQWMLYPDGQQTP